MLLSSLRGGSLSHTLKTPAVYNIYSIGNDCYRLEQYISGDLI